MRMSETEFWQVIEHLFAVGIEKKKIVAPFGKKLPKRWSPSRHYVKTRPNKAPEPTPPSVTPPADAGVAPAGVVAHLYQNVGGSRITNKISGGEL